MGRSPTGGFRGGLARGGQKRGRQADFQAAIVQEIEALLGRPAVQGLDFEALETAARQRPLQVAARALEGWSNADTSDHTGAHLACACGAPALHRGRHGKKLRKCSRHPARGASLLLLPDVSERRLPAGPCAEFRRPSLCPLAFCAWRAAPLPWLAS